MNLRKVLLFTAPVALAGFLYLGEAVGIGEVMARTVKTVITQITHEEFSFVSTRFNNGEHYENTSEYEDGDYIYVYSTKTQSPGETGEYVYYNGYKKTITIVETEINIPDDADTSKVVPTVDPEIEAAKKREEAALEVQRAVEKKTEDFTKEITKSVEQAIKSQTSQGGQNNSNAVGTAVIKTDYFTCFTKDMMDLLAANPNINYEIHYRYKGKRYVVVIPAGTDYSKLQDSNGYYGFRYLDSIFGGYEEGTK